MSEELTAEIIYEYDHHRNIPWNIVEYDPLRNYHGNDVESNTTTRYVTKKGFYMDQHIKYVTNMPSPDKYENKSAFDQEENKKFSQKIKINPRLKKNSYLDQIQRQGKKLKVAIGSYNIQKTYKQVQEQIKKMRRHTKSSRAQRPSFYEDIQVLSNAMPGAGNYNPHLDVAHPKKQRMTPDNWRKKHVEQNKQQIKKKKKIPGPTSYRPVSAGTFDSMKLDTQRDKKKRSKSFNKSFGTDAKFIYCRPSKKKIIEQRPDPTRYDLKIQWNGKKDEMKKHGWNSFISTRSNSFSIYNA